MITEAWQIVVHGKSGRQVYTLSHSFNHCWTIGRSAQNTITIHDVYLSRYHAVILLVGNDLLLIDLNSRNGSFVNGRRIISPTVLKNGDHLRLGSTEMELVIPQCRRSVAREQETVPVLHPVLTPSEEKVFWQVVQGYSNKEIGRRLQISPRTVQTHLSSIMAKLTLENRSQIVRFAFEQQFRSQHMSQDSPPQHLTCRQEYSSTQRL
ncbi:MAG: FHA domain-containing protein [Pseudanabaenaceae cyanobacterium]